MIFTGRSGRSCQWIWNGERKAEPRKSLAAYQEGKLAEEVANLLREDFQPFKDWIHSCEEFCLGMPIHRFLSTWIVYKCSMFHAFVHGFQKSPQENSGSLQFSVARFVLAGASDLPIAIEVRTYHNMMHVMGKEIWGFVMIFMICCYDSSALLKCNVSSCVKFASKRQIKKINSIWISMLRCTIHVCLYCFLMFFAQVYYRS